METIVPVNLTLVCSAKSVPGRPHQGHKVKDYGVLAWHIHCKGHIFCGWEKLEVSSRKSNQVITAFRTNYSGSHFSAESTRFENDPCDYGTVRKQAEVPRGDVSIQRARIREETASDSVEDEKLAKGFSASWARLAGARCALNTDEEQSLSADVQDMLSLESQKKDLEKILGREPTVDEWAGHCETSIFKLYARIGKGRAAKRKMIAAGLSLVNSVAQQFHGRGLSHWELCQEGVQGLERSAEKYNTSHNTKFSSYSFLWIWERMSAGVKKFRHVLRISRTVYETASMLLQTKEEFQVSHGRSPSVEELADVSRVNAHKIRNVVRLLRPAKSMHEVVSTLEADYEGQVEDKCRDHVPWEHIMESELKTEVAKALQCLTSREQMVLEMRYGLCGEPPKGRAQVGVALNLSYESIRLIEKKALNKLRHSAKEGGLQQYLSGSVWVK